MSGYILVKKEKDWTDNQAKIAAILCKEYSELKKYIITIWN